MSDMVILMDALSQYIDNFESIEELTLVEKQVLFRAQVMLERLTLRVAAAAEVN